MSKEIHVIEPWGEVRTNVSFDGTSDWMSPFIISWTRLDKRSIRGHADLPYGLFLELAEIHLQHYVVVGHINHEMDDVVDVKFDRAAAIVVAKQALEDGYDRVTVEMWRAGNSVDIWEKEKS